jgi:hypothetical protein
MGDFWIFAKLLYKKRSELLFLRGGGGGIIEFSGDDFDFIHIILSAILIAFYTMGTDTEAKTFPNIF